MNLSLNHSMNVNNYLYRVEFTLRMKSLNQTN